MTRTPLSATRRSFQVLGFSSAVLGVGASVVASVVHYRLMRSPFHPSFCDVNSAISCTQVYLSPFGSLYGVPVAVFGVIWFSLVTVLATTALVSSEPQQHRLWGYVFCLALPAIWVTGFLAFISLNILNTICLLCVATYIAAFGVTISSGVAKQEPVLQIVRHVSADVRSLASRPFAYLTILTFAVAASAVVKLFASENARSQTESGAPLAADQRADFEQWLRARPYHDGFEPPPGVKVLVVKFNDFECPPCGRSFHAYEDIFARYDREQPGAVRLVLRDFPLDGKCNPYVPNGGKHPSACDAAVAVRLARLRDRDGAMERWLFGNQPSMTSKSVRTAAREVGQVVDFDLKYAETLKPVQADIELAHRLAVKSTPTFFINGREIEGMIPPRYFRAAIEFALRGGNR